MLSTEKITTPEQASGTLPCTCRIFKDLCHPIDLFAPLQLYTQLYTRAFIFYAQVYRLFSLCSGFEALYGKRIPFEAVPLQGTTAPMFMYAAGEILKDQLGTCIQPFISFTPNDNTLKRS